MADRDKPKNDPSATAGTAIYSLDGIFPIKCGTNKGTEYVQPVA